MTPAQLRELRKEARDRAVAVYKVAPVEYYKQLQAHLHYIVTRVQLVSEGSEKRFLAQELALIDANEFQESWKEHRRRELFGDNS